jgi:hypothetical protein
MYSRTDHYRRRAIQARQRAAQAIDPSLKANFEDAAENWKALAEQAEWVERKHGRLAKGKPRRDQGKIGASNSGPPGPHSAVSLVRRVVARALSGDSGLSVSIAGFHLGSSCRRATARKSLCAIEQNRRLRR